MKKKRIPLIIAAAILLAGIALIIVGNAINNGAFRKYPELDPFNISDEDVGKMFGGKLFADPMPVEETGNGRSYLLIIADSADKEIPEVTIMCCDVPKSSIKQYDQSDDGWMTVSGTVRKCDDEMIEKARNAIIEYFELMKSGYDEMESGEELYEADLKNSLESLSPYYLEAEEAVKGNGWI